MSKFEDKSNNQLLLELKSMQAKHEAIKQRMLKDYDELMAVEKEYAEANRIIARRLKGDK
jgi:regulator of sirC expression with transglutaminase-like and TPR domain